MVEDTVVYRKSTLPFTWENVVWGHFKRGRKKGGIQRGVLGEEKIQKGLGLVEGVRRKGPNMKNIEKKKKRKSSRSYFS